MNPPNLLEILQFVRAHFRRLLLWALAAGIVGLLLCFVLPPTFRATAVILPPEEDDLTSALSVSRRTLGTLAGIGRFGSYFTQADVALAILRSRTIREEVSQETGLQAAYHAKSLEDAQQTLKKKTTIKQSTDGTISVTASDRDRDRAAAIANAFLAHLDRFNREIRSFQARRTRAFLERRVAQCDSTLGLAEQTLALYQKKKGSIILPPTTRGLVDAGASLMARKLSAEVELDLLRSYASPRSEEVKRQETLVSELRRQVGQLPSTQVGGADLIRQVAVQEELYEILSGQLEQARIREAMDTPTIQILDSAQPPRKPSWPRKLWMTALGLLLGSVFGVLDVIGFLPWAPRRTL